MSNEKKLVLLVDDDPDYLFQLEMMVKNLGFRVKTAESQAEGESVLDTLKPDLAIFDLMMENEDSGFILSYKAKRKYPDLPIIIATAATAETGFTSTTKSIRHGSKPIFTLKKVSGPTSYTVRSTSC